ncbi:MAG: hypothetical protein UIM53_05420 [Acutalibacteraceae bacterium]|nr:hypothetical protein [Acutalibacteraceae bacterium]
MKIVFKKIMIILPAVAILFSISLLTGCNNTSGNELDDTTISIQTEKDNESIFKKADNNINAAVIEYRCTLNDFKKYNISKDVYTRITSSVYISDVEKDIGIPVLRKIDSMYYSVHPIKDDNGDILYGFIMYKNNGAVVDGWCTSKLHTITDFSDLKQGDKLSKVNKIDPYHCFMENISENTATSYHKLPDGKQYVIQYKRKHENSEYVITYARQKDDSCLFTKILCDSDIKLIE